MFEEEKQHGIEEGHFNEDVSDDTVWESVYEVLNSYLEDEKLNIAGKSSNTIVAIVDIGRWDGRVQGYRTFNCISEIFASGCDYSKWYSDGYNIRSTMTHHDGTNYILYREIKDEDKLEQFLEIIYSGKEISKDRKSVV